MPSIFDVLMRSCCCLHSSFEGASAVEAAAAAAVYQALVQAALKDVRKNAHEDEAEGEAADHSGAGSMATREVPPLVSH